ncbi:MAG: hypothetical protein WKF44_01085 [Rubrobacteraceae bacterium]
MRGNHTQNTQHVGPGRTLASGSRRPRYERRTAPKYTIDLGEGLSASPERQSSVARRETHDTVDKKVTLYRRRRAMAISLLLLGLVALVFAVFTQTSVATEGELPIDPNNAAPDAVLAVASGTDISTPIRPVDLIALGYHPEGESLVELVPRGENLSDTPLLNMFGSGATDEKIQYYAMDPAERSGPRTGAVDVGAEAGTTVYAPVTGTITAIRPDPSIRGANVVEIKPSGDPNLRVSVSLVRDISEDTGVDASVTAGMTEIGAVADSANSLEPQLASYTTDAGNHVTLYATRIN